MSNRLDPLTLPLAGRHLIEASAGTGKTWTIAALYLRQLLENRREPGQLLVVTFTEAAAAELRERIAARLHEARDALAGGAADEFLTALLARLADRSAAAVHLDDALLRLDELAVYTIHGFCGRVLADHAFSAASRFEADIETDTAPLTAQILGDFWRRCCADADAQTLPALYALWPRGPVDLAAALKPLDGKPHLRLLPRPGDVDPAAAQAALAGQLRALAAAWPGGREAALTQLLEFKGLSRTADNGYKPDDLQALFAAIDAWAADPRGLPPAGHERLAQGVLATALTAGARKNAVAPPEHPLFTAIEAVQAAAGAFGHAVRVRTVHDALAYLASQRAARLAAAGRRGFDSLLRELDAALTGPGGAALAGALAQRYPVLMIDEFQDTDPLQYRLFERLLRAAGDGFGMYLIGDPKQAIYQFRGADVFAYLAARADVPPDRRHTLGVNQRSTQRLVDVVNAVFGRHPRPFVLHGEGQVIDFEPVDAAGRCERTPLLLDGVPPPACELWWLDGETSGKPLSKEAAGERALAALAARVAQLLALGAAGRACIGDLPLAGQHIGILVRTNRQAGQVQAALRAVGVDSVCLREDSVFDSTEAQALERILQAALDPADATALRAALATPLLGASAADIAALDSDEAAFERQVALFQSAQRRWQAAGPLPMLLGLMQEAGVIGRLHAGADGARSLTNLLHLGELLQAQAGSRPGLDAQLRYLRDVMAGAVTAGDAQQLRLESDANLVQIVTVHKSKGLEWEIVFLPFAWDQKTPNAGPPFTFHDPGDLTLVADLDPASAHAAQAAQEALAEQVRLLYVALTRARQHCALPFGRVNQADQGALGWLLYGEGGFAGLDEDAARAPWQALAEASGGALVMCPPPVGTNALSVPARPQGRARVFDGRIDRRWRVTSYSALAAGAGSDRPDHDAVDQPPVVAEAPVPPPPGAAASVARFPRGAAAGTALHSLFERLDFPAAHGPVLADAVAQTLQRAGYPSHWHGTLERLVGNVLDTPLDGQALCLRNIARAQRRDELEFYFPLAHIEPATLNRLVSDGTTPALRFEPVQGVLKGYIDLVFEYQGRFYLADYKSNWLGHGPADYARPALWAAIAEHRYDLQYLVYTVALHRYLRQRLPDYDYARHFGGVYYLFLRGMAPGHGTAGVWYDCPAPERVAALEAALCGEG
ncbi:exodeoxyribonuclease V subunit beta [Immundisolibacter sp.]|uniref:exodeoxyribonuclease V subunit beta n=1 Tax=Immundisolibacter sp. TaxID=1934948 RepID=UPI00356AE18F